MHGNFGQDKKIAVSVIFKLLRGVGINTYIIKTSPFTLQFIFLNDLELFKCKFANHHIKKR